MTYESPHRGHRTLIACAVAGALSNTVAQAPDPTASGTLPAVTVTAKGHAAGAVAALMSLGLAERIEVVKGPSSVLYGSGALGGVVNVAAGDHALMLGWAPLRADDYRAPAGEVPRTGYDSDRVIGKYRWRLAARVAFALRC